MRKVNKLLMFFAGTAFLVALVMNVHANMVGELNVKKMTDPENTDLTSETAGPDEEVSTWYETDTNGGEVNPEQYKLPITRECTATRVLHRKVYVWLPVSVLPPVYVKTLLEYTTIESISGTYVDCFYTGNEEDVCTRTQCTLNP